jgi:hypothetical protein
MCYEYKTVTTLFGKKPNLSSTDDDVLPLVKAIALHAANIVSRLAAITSHLAAITSHLAAIVLDNCRHHCSSRSHSAYISYVIDLEHADNACL